MLGTKMTEIWAALENMTIAHTAFITTPNNRMRQFHFGVVNRFMQSHSPAQNGDIQRPEISEIRTGERKWTTKYWLPTCDIVIRQMDNQRLSAYLM
jgi:hypothetical protein